MAVIRSACLLERAPAHGGVLAAGDPDAGRAGGVQVVGRPLQTAAAPQGIVSYELAGDPATTQAILDSWGPNARVHAGFSLGLDTLFMPLYAATIALSCLWGAGAFRRRRWPLVALGRPLAWGVWLAALCDVVENIALWRLLVGPVAVPWPLLYPSSLAKKSPTNRRTAAPSGRASACCANA